MCLRGSMPSMNSFLKPKQKRFQDLERDEVRSEMFSNPRHLLQAITRNGKKMVSPNPKHQITSIALHSRQVDPPRVQFGNFHEVIIDYGCQFISSHSIFRQLSDKSVPIIKDCSAFMSINFTVSPQFVRKPVRISREMTFSTLYDSDRKLSDINVLCLSTH